MHVITHIYMWVCVWKKWCSSSCMCREQGAEAILQALRDENLNDPRDRIEIAQTHAFYRPSLLGHPWLDNPTLMRDHWVNKGLSIIDFITWGDIEDKIGIICLFVTQIIWAGLFIWKLISHLVDHTCFISYLFYLKLENSDLNSHLCCTIERTWGKWYRNGDQLCFRHIHCSFFTNLRFHYTNEGISIAKLNKKKYSQ